MHAGDRIALGNDRGFLGREPMKPFADCFLRGHVTGDHVADRVHRSAAYDDNIGDRGVFNQKRNRCVGM